MTQPIPSNNSRSRISESGSIAYSAPSNLSATALDNSAKDVDDHPFEEYVVTTLVALILLPYDLVSDEKLYNFSFLIHGTSSFYHPWNASLFVVWVALIAIEITLMERSVALAPTTTSPLWYFSTSGLLSVLITIFAQGHGIVTTICLSRLFVSALNCRYSRPRTWMEMFWTANQSWSGPVSILKSISEYESRRFSSHSLFSVLSQS